ncbi:MAG: ParB N-terminal domain-containing protein [Planctomycetes bacterium]|nr:ParB N-terminal domain-containing protein [Planctomycetota bacterium]MBU4399727.1 ParB N-terminal domain-containing protein [Planctomycetota bacterium]MCG2685219.1 ParB N-terminal domain-containing protein [Planctomycetales bacterium]
MNTTGTEAGPQGTAKSSRNRRLKREFSLDSIRRVPIDKIQPSPENAELYRPVDPDDPEIVALAESIAAYGVQEPLVLTSDHYILSGHRRHTAAMLAGLTTVPCRFSPIHRTNGDNAVNPRFMVALREANRQRIKTFDEKLREEVVSADPEVAYESLIEHRKNQSRLNLDSFTLRGEKKRASITKAKWPFLEAIQKIIEERRDFWPLSDRQIHYGLLNDPPLIHASKPGSTYRSDAKSYKALTELLTRARVAGIIPMHIIQDATRPVTVWNVHRDVQGYIRKEVEQFCQTYWRDLMQSQPDHIEIVGEKNTIEPIIRPIAAQYTIPMTTGRGYCSLRPRFDISERFRKSGKDRLVLLMLSDFDPDGEEIAHSFARSLRDDFGIVNIEPIKVALTADQVQEFDLPPAMKAKRTSTNYQRFADKHGDEVWELEALPPDTLQEILRDSIDSVIDVAAFNNEIDQEKADAVQLEGVRRVVLDTLSGFDGGGDV